MKFKRINNHTREAAGCQEPNKTFSAIDKRNINLLLNSPKSHLIFLNNLIQRSHYHQHIYSRQDTLGRGIDRCPRTVRRICDRLEEWGLMRREWRGVKKTCHYYINPALFSASMVALLKHLLPALIANFLYINLLFSAECPTKELNLFINNKAKRITELRDKHTTKRVENLRVKWRENVTEVPGRFLKRGVVMEICGEEPPILESLLPKAVHEIKSVQLTLAGKVKLSPFPDAVLKYVDSRLLKAQGIKDPIAFMCKLANQECAAQGIQPRWDLKSYLQKHLRVSDNSPCYTNYVMKPAQSKPWMKYKSSAVAGAKSSSMDKSGGRSGEERILTAAEHRAIIEARVERDRIESDKYHDKIRSERESLKRDRPDEWKKKQDRGNAFLAGLGLSLDSFTS